MSPRREDAPSNLRSLTTRIDHLAREQARPMRRVQRAIANTVVGQMLPPGVVKGGTAIKLRVGEAASRFTPDLDVALDQFTTFNEPMRGCTSASQLAPEAISASAPGPGSGGEASYRPPRVRATTGRKRGRTEMHTSTTAQKSPPDVTHLTRTWGSWDSVSLYLDRCQVATPDRLVKATWDHVASLRSKVDLAVDFGAGDGRFARYGQFKSSGYPSDRTTPG